MALAALLNATLVLPRWYRSYDHWTLGSVNFATAAADPQAEAAVPMADFWDVGHVVEGLRGLVRVRCGGESWCMLVRCP